jgi:hypothetical protein
MTAATLTRVQQSTAATITHRWRVGEALSAATGALTATVKRLDGTSVAGSPFAIVDVGGVSTFTLPVGVTGQLDTYSVDFAATVAGVARVERDFIEIVGGFFFDVASARSILGLTAQAYPAERLEALRIGVEREAEEICRRAFVPRFTRVKVSGTGGRLLGTPSPLLRPVRALRAVVVGGVAWSAGDVAAVTTTAEMFARPLGAVWPAGFGNIILEFEYGDDFAPPDIAENAMIRLRPAASRPNSQIPDRAMTFQTPEGGTYRLSMPSRDRTGIPDVDAIYERHTRLPRPVVA